MAVAEDPQTALDERVLENTSDLEAALDKREQKKVARRAVNKDFREADAAVKALLEPFGLGDAEVVRVGKYRIEKRMVPGGARAFETSDAVRLIISADKTQLEITES
jgi:hypothetical protein